MIFWRKAASTYSLLDIFLSTFGSCTCSWLAPTHTFSAMYPCYISNMQDLCKAAVSLPLHTGHTVRQTGTGTPTLRIPTIQCSTFYYQSPLKAACLQLLFIQNHIFITKPEVNHASHLPSKAALLSEMNNDIHTLQCI